MFFTFDQNNSDGKFHINNTLAVSMIMEANSAQEANSYAEGIGLYFNGSITGIDCKMGGDRWSAQWVNEPGTEEPVIDEIPVNVFNCRWTQRGGIYCRVFKLDGSVDEYIKGKHATARNEKVTKAFRMTHNFTVN